MAYAFIAASSGINTDHNNATTGNINSAGATVGFIVVGINFNAAIAVSDNKGNVWVLDKHFDQGGGYGINIYRSELISVGSGHNFSVAAVACFPTIHAAVFSGGSPNSLDQSNGAAALQTGSVTPASPNELLISSAITIGGGVTFSAVDSGFTNSTTSTGDAANFAMAVAYLIETTATAKNPIFTASGGSGPASTIVTYSSALLAWHPDMPDILLDTSIDAVASGFTPRAPAESIDPTPN